MFDWTSKWYRSILWNECCQLDFARDPRALLKANAWAYKGISFDIRIPLNSFPCSVSLSNETWVLEILIYSRFAPPPSKKKMKDGNFVEMCENTTKIQVKLNENQINMLWKWNGNVEEWDITEISEKYEYLGSKFVVGASLRQIFWVIIWWFQC